MKKQILSLIAASLAVFSMQADAMDESRRVALRDSILSVITGAEIQQTELSILKFGARPDGVTDCRKAFDKAMAKAAKNGGAKIVVPAGEYFIKGPINFVSNVTLHISEGATLRFSPDPTCYPVVDTSWEGTFLKNYSAFIAGYGVHDVAITGAGTIDGNAQTTFATWRKQQGKGKNLSREMNHSETPVADRVFGDGYFLRPQLIQFYNCERVTIEGVKIINSPFWCVHLLMSENIICRNLRYDAKLVNNDGIDPECSRDILIEGVEFDNGDDNVAIKSGRDNDGWTLGKPSENIIIRNCRFKGLHAVVIGSEMSAGVNNVIVENCTFAGYCKRGIYVKTNSDRGGQVTGLWVSDCTFGEVEDLFYVTSRYAGEGGESKHYPRVSGIRVNGLKCDKATAAALVLQGNEGYPVSDVRFDNVEVGEAKIGLSFERVKDVEIGTCDIGGHAGTPTLVTKTDRVFDR